MKLTCIKLDNKAKVILGKDKGETHHCVCPSIGEKVDAEFTPSNYLRIKGYEKDSEGNSIYFDPSCFATNEELAAMFDLEIKEALEV